VGNEIGRGDHKEAMEYAKRILIFTLVVFSIDITILATCRPYILSLFSPTPHLMEYLLFTFKIELVTHVFDFASGVLSGFFRALGKQAQLVLYNFICFDLIILPLSIYLILYIQRTPFVMNVITK
jgi:Na+-driven multidrug efflux pump